MGTPHIIDFTGDCVLSPAFSPLARIARAQARRERREQGLPPTLVDAGVIHRLAQLMKRGS